MHLGQSFVPLHELAVKLALLYFPKLFACDIQHLSVEELETCKFDATGISGSFGWYLIAIMSSCLLVVSLKESDEIAVSSAGTELR